MADVRHFENLINRHISATVQQLITTTFDFLSMLTLLTLLTFNISKF